jgi:uncharacterized protein involved in outer membrane biogenesis
LGGAVLETLNRLRKWNLPDPGPLELAAHLTLDSNGAALRDIELSVAGSALTGNLQATGAIAHPRIVGELRAQSIDLGGGNSAGAGGLARAGPAVSRSLLDRELSLEWLDALDATVDLEIGALLGLPIPVRNVGATAQLAGGALEVTAAVAEVAGVSLMGRARVGRRAGQAQMDLEVRAARIELGSVLAALGVDDLAGFTASAESASLVLDTQGRTLRSALAASDATLLAADIELGIDDARRATARSLRVDVAEGTWPRAEIDITGNHRAAPVQITAEIADLTALAARAASKVRIGATWGPLAADAAGTVVPAANLVGTVLDFTLATEDANAAAELLGAPRLPAGQGSFAAHATIGERQWDLTGVHIAAPAIVGTGELHLRLDDRRAVQGRLAFESVDLTPYAAARESEPETDASRQDGTDASSEPSVALHRLYSPRPFALDALRRWEADLELQANAFRFGAFVTSAATARLAVSLGMVTLDAALDGGRMRTNARVDARTDAPEVTLQLSGDAVPLAADRTGVPAEGTAVVDLDANFAGRGASSQALVESLSGDLLLYVRGGRVQGTGLRFLFGSVLYQLLDVINPFSDRESYVDLECAGVYFTLADGIISTENGIVIQTPDVQIVGVGNTNLASGELTMRFRTKPRSGVVSIGGIVNEFVELTGTLDAPRVAISPERATRTGILAVVTGGLSILATDLFRRMTAKDVCPELPSIVGAPGAEPAD